MDKGIRGLAVFAGLVLVTVAVAMRIPQLRKFVIPSTSAS